MPSRLANSTIAKLYGLVFKLVYYRNPQSRPDTKNPNKAPNKISDLLKRYIRSELKCLRTLKEVIKTKEY